MINLKIEKKNWNLKRTIFLPVKDDLSQCLLTARIFASLKYDPIFWNQGKFVIFHNETIF